MNKLPNAVDDDLSPEEIRFAAYEQINSCGNCMAQTQSLQELSKLKQQQKSQILALLQENENARKLLLGGEKLSKVQSMSSRNTSFPNGQTSAFSTQFGASASTFPPTQHQSSFQSTSSAGNPFASASVLTSNNSFQNNVLAGNNIFNGSATATSGFNAFTNTAPGSNATGFGASNLSPTPFGVLPTAFGNTGSGQHGQIGQPGSGIVNPFSAPAAQQTIQSSIATFGGNSEPTDSMVDEALPLSTCEPVVPPTARTLFAKPASTPSVFQSKGVHFSVPSNLPFSTPIQEQSVGAGGSSNASVESSKQDKSIIKRDEALGNSQVTTTAGRAGLSNSQNAIVRDEAWNLKQYEASEFVLGMVPTVPPPMHLCQ
uniref:AlNc14C181G8219 protein n=1 Tax=Albugo laibachii Nc14 TaxID=890382 RepID=F0WP71_9STRA|nr:AlNc14C181G8219 [Albugo laibachii Nc14]|eukprot:CCA23117.1 AlNc14C181G8219 [Albugo laibachii Nc14]